MRTKPLGRTGREVSVIGMGTAFLGRPPSESAALTAGAYEIDHQLGLEALVAGLRAGVTLIDTAPFYRTEPIVGEALRASGVDRASVTVMTKAGRPGIGEFDFSRDAVLRHVEGSLERLGLDHLDVVSIHDAVHEDPDFIMSDKGAYGGLAQLRDEGVIGAVGTACYDPDLNARYIATGGFDTAVCSASWSMLNLTLADKILPAAREHNVGLLIAEPLERGLLAVGVEPGREYADRKFSPAVLARVTEIQQLCAEYGVSILAAGLQWLVRADQVSASIPGAANANEAIANAAAGDTELPEEFWTRLDPLVTHWQRADLGIEIK
ncbi:aldo/keto reductase [Actinoplanes bogorensis]|uniref:Aldo/keto reductase n=1 Tax=Paractinoplanes bogorensis TaxID=1610840 RepID=A0ABS5YJH3_9ACTN|nr:aldo/keto reductase [Actinoplanes bogorensis]MBU2663624.1 aldo/keto reductase [Actinoplanes bogorensis]